GGLVGLSVRVALAVAIGIENEGRPALRFFFVVGLIPHFDVQPADCTTAAAAAGPESVVGVLGELQVVGAEASANEVDFLGLGIIHGEVAARGVQRKNFCGRMA